MTELEAKVYSLFIGFVILLVFVLIFAFSYGAG